MSDSDPPRPLPALTGLVLAGGASRRMGRDKAMLVVDGEPLVRRAVRRLATCCQDVFVASGDGRRLDALGCEQVADAAAGAGPLAGIVAGLEAARTPLVAVVAVDMPFAEPDVLCELARRWDGGPAVIPAVEGRPQPLHGVYATAAAGKFRRALAEGRRGVTDVVVSLGGRVFDAADLGASDRFATNLNVPDDLDAITAT